MSSRILRKSANMTMSMALLALGLAAGVPARAAVQLDTCSLHLRTDAQEVPPGEPLVLFLHAECRDAQLPGVALELWQDAGGSARSIATLRDATLGGAPIAFPIAIAEVSCFLLRATRGDDVASVRACLEAIALEIPAATLRTASRGAAPGDGGLAQCRVLGLATAPGPRFASGASLTLSAAFVCPAAVPRVHVSLLRHGRAGDAAPFATSGGVSLRKGRTVVALPAVGVLAPNECLRVHAERAGQEIESQTCVRPAALRLAPAPALHASSERVR